MTHMPRALAGRIAIVLLPAATLLTASLACAQAPTPAPTPAPVPSTAPSGAAGATTTLPANGIAAFDWLQGCWHGMVNQREFREQWLPLAGGMMVGAGHTVTQGRTQDYEYLRLEARDDGVYYVAVPSGQKETSFRLAGVTREEGSNAEIFTFDNVAEGFPQHIVYRRGGEGWLYAGIEGTLNGETRKVIYPMRHVSCESGEIIRQ
jgi:hypothetical protein